MSVEEELVTRILNALSRELEAAQHELQLAFQALQGVSRQAEGERPAAIDQGADPC